MYREWNPVAQYLLPPWAKPVGMKPLYYILDGDHVRLHPVDEVILPPWGEVPVWCMFAGFLGWSPRVGKSVSLKGRGGE